MERLDFSGDPAGRQKWWVCIMLFLATMMMYMDRQVLAQSSVTMTKLGVFTDTGYGLLEKYFSYAFAIGSIFTGLLADRMNVRILYPILLVGWSTAGILTPYSEPLGAVAVQVFKGFLSEETLADPKLSQYVGLLICRIMLGVFEAGHWPCAIITTKLLLEGKDRNLGNSILQSGATIGTIFTPLAIGAVHYMGFAGWGVPFIVIGVIGIFWVIPWAFSTQGLVLRRQETSAPTTCQVSPFEDEGLWRRIIALAILVTVINLTWQVFRAWLPKMIAIELESESEATRSFATSAFTIVYFLLADIGCLMAGAISKFLAHRGMSTHTTRLVTYVGAAVLTAMGGILAVQATGYTKLSIYMLIGFGSLALFPTYYSLSQEISSKNQGFITGIFGAGTWFVTGYFQGMVGKYVENASATVSQHVAYSRISLLMSAIPLIGAVAIWFIWQQPPAKHEAAKPIGH